MSVSPVTVAQGLLGPSVTCLLIYRMGLCHSHVPVQPWATSLRLMVHASHVSPRGQWSGPGGPSHVPYQPPTPGCRHQRSPWEPPRAGVTTSLHRDGNRLREVKWQRVVTEPMRWIQDSDPSPADSAVVHRSRRPCQEQPPPRPCLPSALKNPNVLHTPTRRTALSCGSGTRQRLGVPSFRPRRSGPALYPRHPLRHWAPYRGAEARARGLNVRAAPFPALGPQMHFLFEP